MIKQPLLTDRMLPYRWTTRGWCGEGTRTWTVPSTTETTCLSYWPASSSWPPPCCSTAPAVSVGRGGNSNSWHVSYLTWRFINWGVEGWGGFGVGVGGEEVEMEVYFLIYISLKLIPFSFILIDITLIFLQKSLKQISFWSLTWACIHHLWDIHLYVKCPDINWYQDFRIHSF